jgi:hypothetical protein
MRMTAVPFDPWMCYLLAVGILGLAGPALFGQEDKPAANRDAKAIARMIDDLANRNTPPPLLKDSRVESFKIPLFPEDYDWKEQDRVKRALRELTGAATAEQWEELIKRADDAKYCLTVMEVTSGLYTLGNWSVGDLCRVLAYEELVGAFEHDPSLGEDPSGQHYIYLKPGFDWEDIADWRKKRMDKSLVELQMEAGDRGLVELAKDDRLRQSLKDDVRGKIQAKLETLRRTKQPILRKDLPGWLMFYSPKTAKECREWLGRK